MYAAAAAKTTTTELPSAGSKSINYDACLPPEKNISKEKKRERDIEADRTSQIMIVQQK